MSNSSRKSGFTKKGRKNTNNSPNSEQSVSGTKNTRYKGRKSRNFAAKSAPDRSRGMKTHPSGTSKRPTHPRKNDSSPHQNWIWGAHAVKAALENPKRTLHTLHYSDKALGRLKLDAEALERKLTLTPTHPGDIDQLLPEGAVHQGLALSCAPLPDTELEAVANIAKGLIIVLDQITDPHNVGAIFRLAAAFDAKAVVMQSRHAPPLMGATAKVAVGTIETVPHVLVTNIANTLLALQDKAWRVTGLAGEADISLQQAFVNAEAEVVVMGAEGPGLRKRVRDCCDQLAKIPMPGNAESLNVSTAAAIALYEAVRAG